MATRTGRFAILEQLSADGVRYIFGNPGTVEQGLLDALGDHPSLTYIMGCKRQSRSLQQTVMPEP